MAITLTTVVLMYGFEAAHLQGGLQFLHYQLSTLLSVGETHDPVTESYFVTSSYFTALFLFLSMFMSLGSSHYKNFS
jgi:hypothetical protein